jgi:branched-chain amino acid transport system substrate-binding protein
MDPLKQLAPFAPHPLQTHRHYYVSKYLKETGSQPIYPVYHMVQAMEAMVGAYDKAIVANDGNWPSKEQLADALHGLTFRGLTSEVTIRPKDGQGLEDQLFGVTTSSDEYDIRILKDIMIVPADLVTTPVGETTPEWLKTLDAGLLDDVDFYREGSGGTQ